MTKASVSSFAKRLLLGALLMVVVAVAISTMRGGPPKVVVVQPTSRELAEVIALSGRVRGVQESQLAPEVTGTVRRLLVAEGDNVRKGQGLATLDTGRLQAQLTQALEKIRVAEAQLAVVSRGPLPSQLAEVRSEVASQKLVASAALESAEQRLLQAQRGPRIEQLEQARASLREASADAEQKDREAQRQAKLLADGAVSKQATEQASTLAKRARESTQNAKARLSELEHGTRPEEVEQARAAVASAQAELLAAQEAGDAKVQQLQDLPRPEDVLLAKAQVEEARSAAQTAKEQLEQANLVAPYDGVVGRRLLRVGDLAGPSQPVFTFSSRPALEIRVDVDESDRARIKLGQQAEIRANGYTDTFRAKVKELSPEVDSVRGTLETRLTPIDPPKWLVPGQTVDVNLILGEQKAHLVLPLTCVILKGEKAQVVIVDGDIAHLRGVEISTPTPEGYLIHSGLQAKDQVALYPQGLQEGQKVQAQSE